MWFTLMTLATANYACGNVLVGTALVLTATVLLIASPTRRSRRDF